MSDDICDIYDEEAEVTFKVTFYRNRTDKTCLYMTLMDMTRQDDCDIVHTVPITLDDRDSSTYEVLTGIDYLSGDSHVEDLIKIIFKEGMKFGQQHPNLVINCV